MNTLINLFIFMALAAVAVVGVTASLIGWSWLDFKMRAWFAEIERGIK